MGFRIIEKALNGLILIEPDVFSDDRGFFLESFRESDFIQFGMTERFVQENHSRSKYGVLRGMHLQWTPAQGKLLRVTLGKAFVAEIDIRPDSPTFGNHWTTELSFNNKRLLWVPAGFANGFLVTSDYCEMQYKCTSYWSKDGEMSIKWNDENVGIKWPLDYPILSDKDKKALSLNEWKKFAEENNIKF